MHCAVSPKARLYGISFERDLPGVYYDTIGPVGADAKVYTELERKSFVDHLKKHAPDMVVLMVEEHGDEQVASIREVRQDTIRYRPATGRLKVSAEEPIERKHLSRLFAEHLLGEPISSIGLIVRTCTRCSRSVIRASTSN